MICRSPQDTATAADLIVWLVREIVAGRVLDERPAAVTYRVQCELGGRWTPDQIEAAIDGVVRCPPQVATELRRMPRAQAGGRSIDHAISDRIGTAPCAACGEMLATDRAVSVCRGCADRLAGAIASSELDAELGDVRQHAMVACGEDDE
ncbi:MAG TPA: hypothetical protein PKC43_06150 [Phycisphaerales bacterium]|nr:hypothetical protein [Phycisphaerales bacterium]HMP37014.1 hypothetical protein [Phycisphaerales bacterium]